MTREPLKATFFAFRRREQRGVLRRTSVAHAGLLLASGGAGVLANANLLARMAQGTAQDIDAAATALWLATFVTWSVLYFLTMASYEAACLRWLIRGEMRGLSGLSLGADTMRVWLGQWLWAGLTIPLFIVGVLVVSFVLEFLHTTPEQAGGPGVLSAVSWAIPAAPLALRLAPGNAASVGRRRFAYFDAWRVSAGRFRALTGSYLIVWFLWAVIGTVVLAGFSICVFAILGDNSERAPLINTLMLGAMALTLVVGNMWVTFLLAGVNARAVLAAAREGKIDGVDTPDDVARVFE
ncbi:MAG: hypothetical protein HY054_06685 [Proteobacteria bacterium]|nr:hypothetical protein [Pseudomonadota bacterium]